MGETWLAAVESRTSKVDQKPPTRADTLQDVLLPDATDMAYNAVLPSLLPAASLQGCDSRTLHLPDNTPELPRTDSVALRRFRAVLRLTLECAPLHTGDDIVAAPTTMVR